MNLNFLHKFISSKNQAYFVIVAWAIICPIIGYFFLNDSSVFPGDEYVQSCQSERNPHLCWSFIHIFLIVVSLALYIIGFILQCQFIENFETTMDEFESDNDRAAHEPSAGKKSSNKLYRWSIVVLVLFIAFKITSPTIKQSKFIFNKSKIYKNDFGKATQELTGFYEKMWKTYEQKANIATVNKDVFIQVSKIIMENKADGSNLAFKFVSEQKLISYQEFSEFYKDLSSFVESQRDAYYKIELKRQDIANSNNILLDTFPNNIYNKLLEVPKIEYKYGVLSDSTIEKFRTGRDNSNQLLK